MQSCNTIAQLRAFIGATGQTIGVLGTAAIGDGGGGVYYWSAASSATDNGSTVIRPTGAAVGAWLWLAYFPIHFGTPGLITLNDFGGSDANSFDNTTALTAAAASGDPIFVPYGTGDVYLNTLYKGGGAYPNRMWGDGVVQGVSFDGVTPQKAARFFTYRDTPPSSFGNWGSMLTAFNGDDSTIQFPIEHWVTGATTLGQPMVSFEQDPECSPFVGYLTNFSGFNNGLVSSGQGRTGVSFVYLKADNYGQGDAGGITVSGFVTGQKAGSTGFLANPACYVLNGGITGGQDYVYLNITETDADDGGHDVAAIGWVFNATRTVYNGGGTAQKYVWWAGLRFQNVGTQPVDTWLSLSGAARFGLDMTFCDFSSNGQAAIAMAPNQRIYFNTVASDISGYSRYPSSLGNEYIVYSSALQAFQFGIAGGAPMNLFSTHLDMAGNINSTTGEVRASGDGGGVAGRNCLTGTSDVTANSTGIGTIKFKGSTSRDSAGFILMRVGTTAFYVPGFSTIVG